METKPYCTPQLPPRSWASVLFTGSPAASPAEPATRASASEGDGEPSAQDSRQEDVLQRLLAQAHRSSFMQQCRSGQASRVKCRACGKAFLSFKQLAQHLQAKHNGINSEDAKYLQAYGKQREGEAPQSQAERGAVPAAAAGSRSIRVAAGSRRAVTLRELMMAGRTSRLIMANARASTVLSASLRVHALPCKPASGRHAVLSAHQPRRRLCHEGVERKQRLSTTKKLVLKQRLGKACTAHSEAYWRALDAYQALMGEYTKLCGRLGRLQALLQGLPPPPTSQDLLSGVSGAVVGDVAASPPCDEEAALLLQSIPPAQQV